MRQTERSQGELSFELLAEIAVGATARVELCRVVEGPLKNELVAVKRLHPHIAEDPRFVDMFRDEVWMTAALKHNHVVEVVGWGQDAVGPWLAVEFVRGVSLQRLMKTVFETGEQFSERMVVYLARSICDGLAEAHDLRASDGEHLNLVHRDLTPGNILLSFDGQVKITDFGLAKAKQRLTKTLTGLLKGQPQYMSPEQMRGDQLDRRSDIFALGVVLFELFSGRRPWAASSDLDVMRAIADEPPADLLSLRSRIDKALVEIVNQCLHKSPTSRWQTAVELRDRFDKWLDVHGYRSDNHVSLARFVRRNAMRQMRWFERAMAGEFADEARANQPIPVRASQLPSPPPPQPAASASSAPTIDQDTAAPQRSVRSRALPSPRQEAPTRVVVDEDTNQRPDDGTSIDWGDDGPTLIKKSETARRSIERSRLKAASARSAAESDALMQKALTQKRDRSIESDDGSEADTVAGRRPNVTPEARDAYDSAADRSGPTVQMGEVGERMQSIFGEPSASHPDALGIVAPPDPDVPPLPPGAGSRPRAPAVPPIKRRPPMEPDRPSAPLPLTADASASTGAAEPKPVTTGPKLPAVDPNRQPDPIAAAQVAAPRHRSGDVAGEARRLADQAKRAAYFAQASARAARLAGEAALAAAEGDRARATTKLNEAQQLEELLGRGELPSHDSIDLSLSYPDSRPAVTAEQMRWREIAILSMVVTGGVLIALLLVALLV